MSFLKKFILFLNVLVALGLITGGLSIYVNPEEAWGIAFFGLLFPYLLLINIFFLFFWVIVRLRYALVSIVAVLLAFPVLKTYFAFHAGKKEKVSSSRSVKVMSYNVRNFDLYNWSNQAKTLDKIIEMIAHEKPDIACFQEFYNADSGNFQTTKQLMQSVGFKYFRFMRTVAREQHGGWGIATFSRYPIVNYGEIKFENSTFNSSLFTDIMIDSTIVRVFNAHLQSVYLSKSDYEYLEHVSEDQDVQMKPTRRIVTKLKHAFLTRAPQAIKMNAEINKSQYPVIVCGDFNDTPASFCYHIVAGDLQDAFLSAGWGMAPTYSGFLSAYRIDYILCDGKFKVSDYVTRCEKYSDHYAIECTLTF